MREKSVVYLRASVFLKSRETVRDGLHRIPSLWGPPIDEHEKTCSSRLLGMFARSQNVDDIVLRQMLLT